MRRDRILLSILLAAAAVRLIHIDAPPIGRHAWRQADTASIARNFHRHGYQLLYPEIDWSIPGYVESEFPIYPWVTAQTYRLTGVSMATARSWSLFGSLLAIVFLYLIVSKVAGRQAARWAAGALALMPASLFFGRAVMPEAWMLAASAAAIYGFVRWSEDDRNEWLLLSAGATGLACLLKLTALHLGLPLAWLAWRRSGSSCLKDARLWGFAGIALLPPALWYTHAYRLGQTYGNSFHIFTQAGSDKWGEWQLLTDPDFYRRVLIDTPGSQLLTWIGLLLVILALFLRHVPRRERLFEVWLIAVIVLLLIANRGSFVHDYYALPLLLPSAALIGRACTFWWSRRRVLIIGATVVFLALAAYRYGRHLSYEVVTEANGVVIEPDMFMAQEIVRQSEVDDLVISCKENNPIWLYLADRRGWGRQCAALDKAELVRLIDRGATLLAARRIQMATPSHHRLASYLQEFQTPLPTPNPVYLARLSRGPQDSGLSWPIAFTARLEEPDWHADWNLETGTWRVEDGTLYGATGQRPARAMLLPPSGACDLCRLEARLSIATLQRRKMSPRAQLIGWHSAEGTEVRVVLDSRQNNLRLEQWLAGRRVGLDRVDRLVEKQRTYLVAVTFDLFDFELSIDGETQLIAASQLPPNLTGAAGVGVLAGEVRLESLTVRSPDSLETPPQEE